MPPDKKSNKNYWLQVGLKMFAESTGWVAFPVVGALYLGRWLDQRQNSGYLYFFVLTGIAFIISCIGLAMIGQKYLRQLGDTKPDDSKSKEKISDHGPRDESNK